MPCRLGHRGEHGGGLGGAGIALDADHPRAGGEDTFGCLGLARGPAEALFLGKRSCAADQCLRVQAVHQPVDGTAAGLLQCQHLALRLDQLGGGPARLQRGLLGRRVDRPHLALHQLATLGKVS